MQANVPSLCVLWSLSPAVELPTDSLGVMNGCPVPLHFLNIHEKGRCETSLVPLVRLTLVYPMQTSYQLHSLGNP